MQKVPTIVEGRYSEIMNIIEGFCKEKLNSEYLTLAENLCAEVCQLENIAINKGKANSWACGIVHALGLRNGLFNGKDNPTIKAGELYKAFGISSSTGLSKSKEVRSLINIEENKWDLSAISETQSLNIVESEKNEESIENEVAVTMVEDKLIKDDEVEVLAKKAIGEVKEAIKELEVDLITNSIDDKLIKANKLADEAWNQKNYYKKVKLAKEALETSEDCAEAYIILSYDNSLKELEQKDLAVKALESAKRVIGEENIDKFIGRFLDVEIAKSYFSAKYRLGTLLWSLGERKEAIEEYKELLRISPEDNLMIRGTLLSWLIAENRDEEVEQIFNTYKNHYLTSVKFSKALYLYKIGKYEEAERALKIANVANLFVIGYITRHKRLPKVIPQLKSLGTEEEAMQLY